MQREKAESRKTYRCLLHLRTESLQPFRKTNACNKKLLEVVVVTLRRKYARPQAQATTKLA